MPFEEWKRGTFRAAFSVSWLVVFSFAFFKLRNGMELRQYLYFADFFGWDLALIIRSLGALIFARIRLCAFEVFIYWFS